MFNEIYITVLTSGELIGCIPKLQQYESKVTIINFIIPKEYHGFKHRIEFLKPKKSTVCSSFLEEQQLGEHRCVRLHIENGLTDEVGTYCYEYVATNDDNICFKSDCGEFEVASSINAAENIKNQPDIINQLEKEINSKVDKVEGKELSSNDYTDEEKAKLAALENYNDTELNQKINTLQESKVDKVEGKELSSNDYTDEEKIFIQNIMNESSYVGVGKSDYMIINE